MVELNKIYNEDCMETMKRMEDNFIDLTVTSPPYDDLRDYKVYNFDFEKIAKELYRITKVGGIVVWIVGDATIKGSETGTSFKQALYFKEIGFNLHDTMIYLKKGFSNPSSNRYHQVFEYMFILSKGPLQTFNPIQKLNMYGNIKPSWNTSRQKSGEMLSKKHKRHYSGNKFNVWEYGTGYMKSAKDKYIFEHPAIFPEKLASDHIISWSNKNDLIYDPFIGSGTTAKMAIRYDRQWIGSEISKEYCEITRKRIDIELNQMRLF